MLPAACNEIVWIILNCRTCEEKIKKEEMKIKTQNEKRVETDMDIWYYTYEKQLLQSGRNSTI